MRTQGNPARAEDACNRPAAELPSLFATDLP